MIWGIIGFVALIIIFLSFTWNPEPIEDDVYPIDYKKTIIPIVEYPKTVKFKGQVQEKVEPMERGKTFESPIVESTKEIVQEKVEPIEEIEPCINYDESHESNSQPFISVNFPTIDELKIIRNTKLAKVYNHFVVEGKVGLVDFPKLNIAHANTYVFKLRRMLKKYDIVITTHLDEKKKFVEYRISNKL